MTATLEEVAVLGEAVRVTLLEAALDEQLAADLELAVVEAATNIIVHAYGPDGGAVEGSLRITPAEIVVELRDGGRPFPARDIAPDFEAPPTLEDLEESGRGLTLMAMLVDSVEREREGGSNLTRLRRASPAQNR